MANTLFRAYGDISPAARAEHQQHLTRLCAEQADILAALDDWLSAGGALPHDWQDA
ncbi:hypothetical protein GCM10027169_16840 [Gordonia jinhuaensis]|uniref:hypothetical protein n=1 Tax=Gordonia jinhuaensis TaxID=1517702 RepID=UPI00166BDCE9|nr:hypothetical protein [Gordonia jinhuaensis]